VISRGYNRTILLVGLLSISAYCTAAKLPILALVALSVFVAGWWYSMRPTKRLLLPRLVVNILLGGVLAYAVMSSLNGINIETIAQLVIFIQLIKLGDRRGPRDDGQILSLSVFLSIAAMLDSNEFLVGVQLLVLLPLLIGAVMLFQIEAGRNGEGEWRQPGERDRGVLVRPPIHALWRAAGSTALSASLGIVVVAGIVFVMMPRDVGVGQFGDWPVGREGSVTGFTDVVKLGTGRVISTSPQVVMEYAIQDEQGVPLGSSTTVYYLRGAVLDRYQNGMWTSSEGGVLRDIDHGRDGSPMTPIAHIEGPVLVQKVTMRTRVGNRQHVPLFAMWKPVRVELSQPTRVRVHHHGIIELDLPVPFTYLVRSSLPAAVSDETVLRRTPASFPSESIRELATQIVVAARMEADPSLRPVGDDVHAARAIQEYLRNNYGYTLEEPALPPGADAIEHFLFTTRTGHCEYFASAMVAMCRTIGINARMVAGYVAAEYQEGAGHYLVRQSNAHAWVEVEAGVLVERQVDALGRWRQFDPTPPGDLARLHRPPPTLLGRVRQMFGAVEYAWNSTVVGFSESDRKKLLGVQGDESYQTLHRLNRLAQKIQIGGAKLFLAAVASGVIAFSVVAIGGFGLVHFHRLLARARGRWMGLPLDVDPGADQPYYRDLLRILRKAGMAKPPWQPPLAFAQTLDESQNQPAAAAAMRQIGVLYYRLRFGGGEVTSQERRAAAAKVRELRLTLRRQRREAARRR
jgi:protein-glutamine gamma-glutamyltransferase